MKKYISIILAVLLLSSTFSFADIRGDESKKEPVNAKLVDESRIMLGGKREPNKETDISGGIYIGDFFVKSGRKYYTDYYFKPDCSKEFHISCDLKSKSKKQVILYIDLIDLTTGQKYPLSRYPFLEQDDFGFVKFKRQGINVIRLPGGSGSLNEYHDYALCFRARGGDIQGRVFITAGPTCLVDL